MHHEGVCAISINNGIRRATRWCALNWPNLVYKWPGAVGDDGEELESFLNVMHGAACIMEMISITTVW